MISEKNKIRYDDPLYGPMTIEEPVIIGLLQTNAVQRLQRVYQHGISALLGKTQPITRLQHSLGVMQLVKHLGATVEEQIAALLHDVSHTAFSHVFDYVVKDTVEQEFHEKEKQGYFENSDIPDTLKEYGYDWHDFLDDRQYTLLEQPSGRLCADRIDYFLRDAFSLRILDLTQVRELFNEFKVWENQIVMQSPNLALLLGNAFVETDHALWASSHQAGLYELTAQLIRLALHEATISINDAWLYDQALWHKICQTSHPYGKLLIETINTPQTVYVSSEDYDFTITLKKRFVDPLVLVNESKEPNLLSDLDKSFHEKIRAYSQPAKKTVKLKVVSPYASESQRFDFLQQVNEHE